MKWYTADLNKYISAKEYIDTLIIPLLPYQLSEDASVEKQAQQGEMLTIFVNELERELTGRTMLLPNYYYLSNHSKEAEIERLNAFIQDAKTQPFEHTFLITSDASWKKHEKDIEGDILWWPGVKSVDRQSKEMRLLIHDQVEQFSELIRSYWS
ncbi:MAG TPA: DUF2487 family protein [Bacillota bacterium]|nr:DUF2487 family protein [Bacillota bacterium]